MTGLFLRYCAACNSATPSVAKGSQCAECGGLLSVVDAFTLIPELGAGLELDQRKAIVAGLPGHDLPAA